MSALAAIFQHDGPIAEPAALLRMLEAQKLRGPDARGTFYKDNVCLGHGLLATTPEDDLAPQPFHSPDGAVVLALDGRLDNREEVAAQTAASLHESSDAALCVAAYARWGEGFSRHLIGDFAIVLWDVRRRTLLCARDPLGARPLYYSTGPAFHCASSPWALFAGSGRTPAPSFDAMALFLAEHYVEQRSTLFRGVFALEPGATLLVTAGAVRRIPSPWPGSVTSHFAPTPQEYVAQFRDVLSEAVRCRLRARGPVAAHVSGGLDSSSVASLATQLTRASGAPEPLLVRCVFPGLSCDETPFSDALAAHLGLPIHSVVMPGDLAAYLPAPQQVPRGTLYNPVSFMLLRMLDAARERGARVTLTGAGSDQLLQPTGYELADALLRGDARTAAELAGVVAAPLSLAPYARLLREGVRRALPPRLRGALRRLLGRGDGLPAWLTEGARLRVRAVRSTATNAPGAPSTHKNLSVKWLANALTASMDYSYSLVLADQIAASCSAEMRHPFFDRRVIELLLGYPNEARAAGPPSKALLRRAMAEGLPPLIRERSSAAEFSPLLSRVLVDEYGERVRALLLDGRLAAAGLIEPQAAAALVESARSGAPVLRDLAALTSLELWLRQVEP